MKILAIETSCDETAVAVIKASDKKRPDFKILSNIVSSQVEIHKKWGGVYPMLAKREHQHNLVPVLMRALKQAKLLNLKSQTPLNSAELQRAERSGSNPKQIQNSKTTFRGVRFASNQILDSILEREPELAKKLTPVLKKYKRPDIDLIAVTNGPGLEPCLWVGINFAKALSYFWDIPIIPINHVEAHILVNFLPKINEISNFKVQISKQFQNHNKKFPAVCLVVSGGHTQLILMKGIEKYKVLGETRDDAAGECFDKCAKILGLGYPGGPIISKLASKTVRAPSSDSLPRPMINSNDYDFSFSGLKTAVLYWVKRKYGRVPLGFACSKTTEGRQYIKQMCVEIQQAIIDVLIKKTIKATKDFNAKSIILGGGVSANKELRKQFQAAVSRHCEEGKARRSNLNLLFPPANLSTDNALMTAVAGYFHRKEKVNPSSSSGRFSRKIEAEANLRIR